jgi:Na+/H+ antiporter NhaC
MSTDPPKNIKEIREPSLTDALIPLVFMIVLLITSIVLFGIDAAVGPLQVALFMSAVVGAVVAHKNGHSWVLVGTLLTSPNKFVPVGSLNNRVYEQRV